MQRRPRTPAPRGPRGLSLIELVVALALFALVATMGIQALNGTLRMRDRGVAADTAHAALGQGLALLRRDLDGLQPLLFFPPGGDGRPASAVISDGADRFALSTDGVIPHQPVRAFWHRRGDGQLVRQAWPVLTPGPGLTPDDPVVVLDGVRAITLRSYWPGEGWRDGLNAPGSALLAADTGPQGNDGDQGGAAAESYSSLLPQLVEITLVTRDHGTLRLVETLP